MKKILTLVCFCLMLPLVTHAAWWNPTTWETFSFFGWKISREAPVEVKKTVETISEVKTVATPTEIKVIMATTSNTSKEKKVEKLVVEAKRIVPVVKKVVEIPVPVVEKNREPEPVFETIFTSDGVTKFNINEYNKFSSDNGQNVVYVNKKNGSRIVPKSTQNYLDAQIQKQQDDERIQVAERIRAQQVQQQIDAYKKDHPTTTVGGTETIASIEKSYDLKINALRSNEADIRSLASKSSQIYRVAQPWDEEFPGFVDNDYKRGILRKIFQQYSPQEGTSPGGRYMFNNLNRHLTEMVEDISYEITKLENEKQRKILELK